MKTETKINTEHNCKYELFSRQIWVMGTTVALLACASIFSRNGYYSFQVGAVSMVGFLAIILYFLFRTTHNKGFHDYFMERFHKYSKTPLARIISLLTIGIIILRFLLPNEVLPYVQITLYMSAGLFLTAGIIILFYKNNLKSQ